MSQQTTPSSGANGHSTVHDIFALSDEQILEIDPEPQDVEVSAGSRGTSQHASLAPTSVLANATDGRAETNRLEAGAAQRTPGPATQAGLAASQGPPAWLAAQMKDAWNSAEARALWDRVQAGENEAAAYREIFAKPEDARAVKALYPGGAPQAQAAAERARLLDEIDRAYFGAQGSSPEQTRTSRTQLAAMMLREDPAAFREMVFEGLRALEAAEKQTTASNATDIPRLAQAFRSSQPDPNVAPPFRAATVDPQAATRDAGLKPGATLKPSTVRAQPAAPQIGNPSATEAQLAAYSVFEKSANAELEKSVGGAIDRALHQALPNIQAADHSPSVGAQATPLQTRLSQAIREDVERALQGDRQLGEQVAQILSGRHLDDATRAQVVRLINARALQLVPAAAKRALSEWTQATLAAHRSRTTRGEVAASRREVAAAATAPRDLGAGSQGTSHQNASSGARNEPRPSGKARVNYGKLSDEQILDL